MSERMILFGGSFNPVHFGHLITARAAAELLGAERVMLVASLHPPHKLEAEMPPAEMRLRMLRAAVDGDPLFEVSDIEIRRGGTSYTVDTIGEFRGRLGDEMELVWLIGADTLPELAGWHRTEDLVKLCRLVTLRRPGSEVPDLSALRARIGDEAVDRLTADIIETPMIDISATDIRQRVGEGKPIRYLTPEPVVRLISEWGLYA